MITDEYILEQLSVAGRLIRKLILNRIIKSDDKKREWIKRYFGGSIGLYQDVYQDLSLKLFENRSSLSKEDIRDQIYTYVRESLLNCFRRREVDLNGNMGMLSYFDILPDDAPLQDVIIDQETHVDEPEDNNEINTVASEINKAKLTNIESTVLKYRYFEDMNYDAICCRLGIGHATAKQHCSNATSKLRTYFILKHPEIYANRASK